MVVVWYVLRVVAVLAFVSCGRSQNADPGPHRDALAAATSLFFSRSIDQIDPLLNYFLRARTK